MSLPKVNPYTGAPFADDDAAQAWVDDVEGQKAEYAIYKAEKLAEAILTRDLKKLAVNKVKAYLVATVKLTAAEADAYFE